MKRKIICTIGLIVLLNFTSFAQEMKDQSKFMEDLKTQLKLTPEQEKSVKAIFDSAREERMALRDGDLDREKRFSKMRDIQEKSNKKIEKALDKKQFEKYLKIMEERRTNNQFNNKQRGRQ
ncbi:MAG: hypothetical protein KJ799_18160 [Bacteroidetes bacterium]|nr:hypothetical protein [Bacteroidota bacterium]MBU2508624.1 hypothetical protein [Bacteroidota bacterium]